ncbi:hypothetical protein GHT06_013191 [Daphnia sinensis]|uniref:Coiled-coil domain-containing protein 22 homolog n=1 Tax=Daphnia sinensis TaxID=1820382 RepID=A0AAD5LG96_9CRUS|nr:hypothetical protein GHT06_013191 [Daphnia sinensis]
MEETDGIIIETLRKIGCDIEDDVTSLAHFTTEIVIEGVVKCLLSIHPDLQLNHKMPPNLPARYKLCMEIAKACKDVAGYKGDLGYETFLHGSQAEIRNVFVILIQKLPKVNEQPIADSVVDPFEYTMRKIQNDILRQLHQPWLPYFCNPSSDNSFPFLSADLPNAVNTGGRHHLLKLSSVPTIQLIPSLIETHISELAADKYQYKFPIEKGRNFKREPEFLPPAQNSRFSLVRLLNFTDGDKKKKKPQPPPKPSHLGGAPKTEGLPTIEEQCQQLNIVMENLERNLQLRQEELVNATEEVANLKSIIQCKETEQDTLRKELDRQEKLLALLPDAPAHLDRMKSLLESNKEKIAALEEQWSNIKKPLEDEYQRCLQFQENSVAEKLKAALESTVLSLRQVVKEIRTKEDAIEKLQTHIESMPSSVLTRTFYTQRILSIVANVKKQNEEMHRVLEDVKSVQREINSIQGKVERTFTVTDEMIFRMAKSDEAARRIYKFLISLQTDCSDIQRLVKESGNLSREIKDLEEQAETELRRNIVPKLRQLQIDLEQIRQENRILEERVNSGGKL